MICAAFQSPDSLLALGEPSISVDQEPLPELLRLLKWYGIKQGVERFLIGCTIVDHVRELQRQARLDEHRILAGLDEEGRKQRYLELAREGAPEGR